MKSADCIEILLATCNSGAYLAPQLDSILAQQDCNWRLLIRDGGSSDGTMKLLQDYARRFPDKIRLLPSGNDGACANFGKLLEASQAELVMFCDHDDVWLPFKVGSTREAFQAAYQSAGRAMPFLVFTDMQVVEADLTVRDVSFFHHEHLTPERIALRQLVLQNVAAGCTILCNRALVELACPMPEEAAMHDHWLILAAATFGGVACFPTATLLYRQHGNNVYGAGGYGFHYCERRLRGGVAEIRRRLYGKCRQAQAFLARYETYLTAEERELLTDFAKLPEAGWRERRRILWKYRIAKSGLLRNLGMYLLA